MSPEEIRAERAERPQSRTVPALLDEIAARHPDLEFVVYGERRWTYRRFRDDVHRFARGLHALGIRRGHHVAILMGNRPEWLIADFAILALGATMVSLNTWATGRELHYMLEHSDAFALVTVDGFAGSDYVETLAELLTDDALAQLRHVIRLDADARTLPRACTWQAVVDLGADEPLPREDAAHAVEPEDVACILYTSGSTSTPKGVQIQHYALIGNMWEIGERLHLQVGDRVWLAVSLFWGLGCENALFALLTHAGTIVLQAQFEPGEAIDIIGRERCTVIYATPNMVRAIADHPDCSRERLASLRTGVTIGTPEQIRLLADLGADEICNVYGLTETCGNCAVTDAHDRLDIRTVSVGRPLPACDLVITDPQSGVRLPAGEVGEIRLRGYVTCGYYRDDARTRAAFDDDGYFLTGDLGYLDADGYLYFQGRLKEMIKTGGINVSPMEVEQILVQHPGVDQAFVIGLPDAVRDEVVAAVVVPNKSDLDEAQLRAHCEAQLAGYKRPRRYRIVDASALPLTTTGKVQKQRMPSLFTEPA